MFQVTFKVAPAILFARTRHGTPPEGSGWRPIFFVSDCGFGGNDKKRIFLPRKNAERKKLSVVSYLLSVKAKTEKKKNGFSPARE